MTLPRTRPGVDVATSPWCGCAAGTGAAGRSPPRCYKQGEASRMMYRPRRHSEHKGAGREGTARPARQQPAPDFPSPSSRRHPDAEAVRCRIDDECEFNSISTTSPSTTACLSGFRGRLLLARSAQARCGRAVGGSRPACHVCRTRNQPPRRPTRPGVCHRPPGPPEPDLPYRRCRQLMGGRLTQTGVGVDDELWSSDGSLTARQSCGRGSAPSSRPAEDPRWPDPVCGRPGSPELHQQDSGLGEQWNSH